MGAGVWEGSAGVLGFDWLLEGRGGEQSAWVL